MNVQSYRCDGPGCDKIADDKKASSDRWTSLKHRRLDRWEISEAHFCSRKCEIAYEVKRLEIRAAEDVPIPGRSPYR